MSHHGERNAGPLQEQAVLLTAEASLQPLTGHFDHIYPPSVRPTVPPAPPKLPNFFLLLLLFVTASLYVTLAVLDLAM